MFSMCNVSEWAYLSRVVNGCVIEKRVWVEGVLARDKLTTIMRWYIVERIHIFRNAGDISFTNTQVYYRY